ncbi:uncharacterized protein MELLADRAFT_109177 [Melampsora larici-populina 98AG31]|uniref:Uncharacterized protein n=1 Tax=Melampsora larici-populina (strain 98AG31 / pathotype 3-4-7) TaxID=747676 RepID=F4RVM3_MELLP|nr:uncharacterized protein MELLADRAFT_109177 [Melampsora larici-populina 98AG31]EGG03555.1 hypothetical protein MELLADRAFT_109177 [Melampsora larici-populina 98AG31]
MAMRSQILMRYIQQNCMNKSWMSLAYSPDHITAILILSNMMLNPYKISPNHSKSVKMWACAIRKNKTLGTLSKFETIRVHSEASPIPPSLSELEKDGLLERFPVGSQLPHGSSRTLIEHTDFVKTGGHMKPTDFTEVEKDLMRWGIRRFSFDWESDLEDRVNTLAREVFWNSFYRAIQSRSYKFTINQHLLRRQMILPVLEIQFKRHASMYKQQCQNEEIMVYHHMLAEKQRVFEEYRAYLIKSGVEPKLTSIFQPRNYSVMGNCFEVKVIAGVCFVDELHFQIPRWWSDKTISLMELIESQVQFNAKSRHDFAGPARPARKYIHTGSDDYGFIPRHLPSDMYSDKFKGSLLPAELAALKMKPSVLPDLDHMLSIFPPVESGCFRTDPNDTEIPNIYYTSDEGVSSDEFAESDTESVSNTPVSDNDQLNNAEIPLRVELESLKAEVHRSKTIFSEFQKELQESMPARLEDLKKAQDEINMINAKIDVLHGVDRNTVETSPSLLYLDAQQVE